MLTPSHCGVASVLLVCPECAAICAPALVGTVGYLLCLAACCGGSAIGCFD